MSGVGVTPDELAATVLEALDDYVATGRYDSTVDIEAWDALRGLVACCTQLREALEEIAEAPGRSVLSLIACEALGVKYGAAVGVSADPPPPEPEGEAT